MCGGVPSVGTLLTALSQPGSHPTRLPSAPRAAFLAPVSFVLGDMAGARGGFPDTQVVPRSRTRGDGAGDLRAEGT